MLRDFGRRMRWQLALRRRRPAGPPVRPAPWAEFALTALLGCAAAAGLVTLLGARIRPIAAQAARTPAENTVTRLVEQAVLADLEERGVDYSDLVTIQRDENGTITALTTDMAQLNRLRGELLERVLDELEGVGVSDIHIPLGSLLDIDFLWAAGPDLKLRSMSVGTVSARFDSQFTSAGVNQTLHRLWLDVEVPMTLILPGDQVEVRAGTRLCVAETVIVGQVPDAFLQMDPKT